MDDEKLIEFVRDYYDMSNPRYMNTNFKDKMWAEIAETLNQPVSACKARWNNIRDNFRKSLKKQKTRNGQASKTRDYKYANQMKFIEPFLKHRDTSNNHTGPETAIVWKIEHVESDDDEYDNVNNNEEDARVQHEEQEDWRKEVAKTVEVNDGSSTSIQDQSPSLPSNRKKKVENAKCKFKNPKTASSTSMKYVLESNEKATQQSIHQVDAFLAGIAPTLKSLNPYNLNIAKSKIFSIVQEIEMEQIMHMQQQCLSSPETPSHTPPPVLR